MIMVELRGLGTARAIVPLGILSGQARANRPVLVSTPATDACQAVTIVFMPPEVFQGCGPWLETKPAPPKLGLVQEMHVSLNVVLMRMPHCI